MKAYKVFNPDWTCRGFQYEIGKTYVHNGDISMCQAGFHACKKMNRFNQLQLNWLKENIKYKSI